jgi:hypothetical protein
MIPYFVVEHWDELARGDSVKFRYIVVPRLETVGFKLRRESTAEFQGKKIVRIKMEPTSRLIAQFVDPLVFTSKPIPLTASSNTGVALLPKSAPASHGTTSTP